MFNKFYLGITKTRNVLGGSFRGSLDKNLMVPFNRATNSQAAKSLKLVFFSSYAGCSLPCLLVSLLLLLFEACALVWGMFVRGCACRDLC